MAPGSLIAAGGLNPFHSKGAASIAKQKSQSAFVWSSKGLGMLFDLDTIHNTADSTQNITAMCARSRWVVPLGIPAW